MSSDLKKESAVFVAEEVGKIGGEKVGGAAVGMATGAVLTAKAATAVSAAAAATAVNGSILGGTIFAPLAIAAKTSVVAPPLIALAITTPVGMAVTIGVAGFAGAKLAGRVAKWLFED